MIKEEQAVRVVSLMLTWQCNLRCTYCFEDFKRSDRTMSAETAERLLAGEFERFAASEACRKGGYLKIEFFGGELIYKRELERLAEWHLAHPDVEPMRLFMQHFIALLEPWSLATPKKNCGTGTTMTTYDTDGTAYPCHLFVPITHGRPNAAKELARIDFHDDAAFQDESCAQCGIRRICKTCYGFNYRDRGDLRRRDRRVCRMMLAEAQVIAPFQIRYLLALKKRRALTRFELLALQGAVQCYEQFHDFSFEAL